MRQKFLISGIAVMLFAVAIAIGVGQSQRLEIAGGPAGGTFLGFAQQLGAMLEQHDSGYQFRVVGTGGSIENIKLINNETAVLGLAHAADVYFARNGLLENETTKYDNILAVGRVFGSTAQLVVRQNSVIRAARDLSNHRVAIGSLGSGAAHSAERFFRTLGIWGQITPIYIGYDLGMSELSAGRADAVWQLVGTPSPSIQRVNRKHSLRLIDLGQEVQESGFLDQYPFYTLTQIPAETYRGQEQPISTFQENSLLITHQGSEPKLIRTAMELIYFNPGRDEFKKQHPNFDDFNINRGQVGILIPLHPTANFFWKGQCPPDAIDNEN